MFRSIGLINRSVVGNSSSNNNTRSCISRSFGLSVNNNNNNIKNAFINNNNNNSNTCSAVTVSSRSNTNTSSNNNSIKSNNARFFSGFVSVPLMAEATTTTTSTTSTPTSVDKVLLRFATPNSVLYDQSKENNEVDMVSIPSNAGELGILPNHPLLIAELQPGVVSIHTKDKDIKKFFVPGGFVIVKEGSNVAISSPEAILLEDLDADAVVRGLQQYQSQVDSAKDDKEKALAQIGVEIHTRMKLALENK